MDHRIYKEIPQVGGPRELGKLQFSITTFYECYWAIVISFASATEFSVTRTKNLDIQPRFF